MYNVLIVTESAKAIINSPCTVSEYFCPVLPVTGVWGRTTQAGFPCFSLVPRGEGFTIFIPVPYKNSHAPCSDKLSLEVI